MDITSFLTAGAYGAIGGVVYAVANGLLDSSDQYFSALQHIGVGFLVGVLAILVFGFSLPTSYADALPFLSFGYAGLDIIQLVAAKLQTQLASKPGLKKP